METPEIDAERAPDTEAAPRPAGELLTRASEVTAVSFPQRTIELIVMPYETPTAVPHQGRIIQEVISRGAFAGIERRANRVRVNRDHDPQRVVGRAISFHPGREEGLVAQVRVAQTELGQETLELADEGCLDASAGFLPMPGGEKWETRSLRRMVKCWLGHIAMTPDPAYEGARVLAVRHAEPVPVTATPLLDEWRELLAQDRLAAHPLNR